MAHSAQRKPHRQRLPWIQNPFTRLLHAQQTDLHSKRLSRLEQHVEEAEEMEQATPIELFYDLFVVGNLTTITGVHFITETRSLASYILFFIILWFTWLHTTLHDVRFAVDSVYERTCKAIHFAIMVGFGSVSTTWDPFDPDDSDTASALKTMTVALMVSRLVLFIQYGVITFYAWRLRRAVLPLAVHCLTMLVAFIIYTQLFWIYRQENETKYYIGWYVVICFEVIMTLAPSVTWPILSFGKTHLVERMGLLTLIVMGEGIVVMLKAVNTVVKATGWDNEMVGIVISGVAIIYFYWMFYFDYNPTHAHYGNVRQSIWTLLHCPYHLALVLSAEGLRQFTTFYSFLSGVTELEDTTIASLSDIHSLSSWLRMIFEHFYNEGSSLTVLREYGKITHDLALLDSQTTNSAKVGEVVKWLNTQVFIAYSEYVGIHLEPQLIEGALLSPHSSNNDSIKAVTSHDATSPSRQEAGLTPDTDPFQKVYALYELVFNYFFASLGLIFLMYGCFAILVRQDKDFFDHLSILLRFATAALLWGLLGIRSDWMEYDHYIGSPWIVPTVCIVLFSVTVMDKTLNAFAFRRERRKEERREQAQQQWHVRKGSEASTIVTMAEDTKVVVPLSPTLTLEPWPEYEQPLFEAPEIGVAK